MTRDEREIRDRFERSEIARRRALHMGVPWTFDASDLDHLRRDLGWLLDEVARLRAEAAR